MSAYKLFWMLLKAILCGRGSAPIYFDTEAREFNYHMARIGSAYLVQGLDAKKPWWIVLYENDL